MPSSFKEIIRQQTDANVEDEVGVGYNRQYTVTNVYISEDTWTCDNVGRGV